jgi:hypothetical protein
MITCALFALRCPIFLKFFYINKFQYWIFFAETAFLCNSILCGSFEMSADIYRSGHGSVKV